jgi:dihydroflavonol-4-reductase
MVCSTRRHRILYAERKTAEAVNLAGTRNVLELVRNTASCAVVTSAIAVFSDTKGESVDESYRFKGTHLWRTTASGGCTTTSPFR